MQLSAILSISGIANYMIYGFNFDLIVLIGRLLYIA